MVSSPAAVMELDKVHGTSKRTGRSSSSDKFSYWSHWSNMNKLGGSKTNSSPDHHHQHHLTEESLEFHNKVHGSLPRGAHVKGYIISTAYQRCSPYYKGLTDSTLVLNREKSSSISSGPHHTTTTSPYPPDHSTTVTTTSTISTTLSSLAIKMQELASSCTKFSCGTSMSSSSQQEDDARLRPATTTTTTPPVKEKLLMFEKDDDDDNEKMKMIMSSSSRSIDHHEKPLRERKVVKKQKALRERMHSSVQENKDESGKMVTVIHSRRYKWADMYRPKTLEDFICTTRACLSYFKTLNDVKLENTYVPLWSVFIFRYSMVLFAGIAAEALVYGEAEGGENDENMFRSICVLLQPPLSVAQMSNHARWSVLQAYNLLKWHRRAHAVAVKALESGASLSMVIRKIEGVMPSRENES